MVAGGRVVYEELLKRELGELTADAPWRASVDDHRCSGRAIGLEVDHDALVTGTSELQAAGRLVHELPAAAVEARGNRVQRRNTSSLQRRRYDKPIGERSNTGQSHPYRRTSGLFDGHRDLGKVVDQAREFSHSLRRHGLLKSMLKLLYGDPTSGAVDAQLIGDSVALLVGCPDVSSFELSRSGHIRLFST